MSLTIALDPGKISGFAIGIRDLQGLHVCYYQHGFDHAGLWAEIDRFQPDNLICESFEFRHGRQLGVDLIPCELIGVVKLYAQDQKCNLYMQTAAQGKGYFGDEKLKDLEIYQKGIPHGRDACRHLLQWFYFGAGFQYIDETTKPDLVDWQWIFDMYL